jgi:hypothetical protein
MSSSRTSSRIALVGFIEMRSKGDDEKILIPRDRRWPGLGLATPCCGQALTTAAGNLHPLKVENRMIQRRV